MDEETPRLRVLLEELHGELSRQPADAVGTNEDRRSELLALKADVENLLARRGASEEATPGEPVVAPHEREHLQGRLQTLAASFEGAHPQLASALEQTMNALSNMGL